MNKNNKLLILLTLICIFMFAFSFALVPFYNLLCKTLGINGKTNTSGVINKSATDFSRSITVGFLTTINTQLPWDFYPKIKQIAIHPGETIKTVYIAKNNSDNTMTAQGIPSITPPLAAKYFKKIACFCFQKQTLQAHQQIEMPVVFYVEPALPRNIHEITLSYSLYQVHSSKK
ncbi:MAG: cytochrome c oxidase assembly protein [Gammaproteobacteria bacterium RIFCSPHIGHO2_12_FULL_40_19]|nr:MAG: cytochrome c oxidase assembly protein [Gammaproteobacteria bacterium RIFCSPHIGHO2_12_FULL_40_19]